MLRFGALRCNVVRAVCYIRPAGGGGGGPQGASSEAEFFPDAGMTILQGVKAFLDGSVSGGPDDAEEGSTGGAVDEGDQQQQQQPPQVEVVFKKGIAVDGKNEDDRDAALSEVRRLGILYRVLEHCAVTVYFVSFFFIFFVA